MRIPPLGPIILLTLGIHPPAMAECTVTTDSNRVTLVELYTSEGCSSCPPADRWLSQRYAAESAKNHSTPLAFHVDYWDHLGWKDRFARTEFTARQRQAASRGLLSFVYTPQVLINGKDFRHWQAANRLESALAEAAKIAPRVSMGLRIHALPTGETAFRVSAQGLDADSRAYGEIYIAVYENGLKSTVNAGENHGRELAHDFVVREWLGPYKLDDPNRHREQLHLLSPQWKTRDAGVTAFVQHRRTGEVLQAVTSRLCD